MKTGPNISLIAALAVLLVVGGVQGARLDSMRETESFYRWVLGAAVQSRYGESLEPDFGSGLAEAMDDELFALVVELAESNFEDLPVEEDDLDETGNPNSVLLRAARQNEDKMIYRLVASAEARPLKEQYFEYLDARLLRSGGTQFSTASLYDEETQVQGVGMTSLFFGFRKVAANFLWLQVDKFWHSGQLHRMVPVMRTCVTLDPSFVDAYLLGAWHLAYNITAKLPVTPEPQKVFHPKYKKRVGPREEWYYIATDFLKDGIRKNPREYRLYFDLGYAIYENKLSDHANAVRYLTEARRYKHDQWVPRMLYLAMWRNGEYENAIKGWTNYLDSFPKSHQAKRFILVNKGYLAEAKAQDAQDCQAAALADSERFTKLAEDARAAGDTQGESVNRELARVAAETARAMSDAVESHWNDARKIWIPMIQADDDSIAQARMLRQASVEYAEDGRYYEAIAQLEIARTEMLSFWDEYSDLMIVYKQDGGIGLTVSERLAVERRQEAALYDVDPPATRKRLVDCQYIESDDVLITPAPDITG